MKNNRKGFTTVELVIVIAVIAILAAVLIPTFTGLIEKANDSAALQTARAAYTKYMTNVDYTKENAADDLIVIVTEDDTDGEYLCIINGELQDDVYKTLSAAEAKNANATVIDTEGVPYCACETFTDSKKADGTEGTDGLCDTCKLKEPK